MYKYLHKFWLKSEELFKATDLRNYKEAVEEAVDYYNEVSSRAKNTKRILSVTVNEKEIEIISESAEPLARPNLALQMFSRFLATGKLSVLVRNKALFRGSAEEITEETEQMSDDELLLEIIKIFRRNCSESQRKISLIRDVVLNK